MKISILLLLTVEGAMAGTYTPSIVGASVGATGNSENIQISLLASKSNWFAEISSSPDFIGIRGSSEKSRSTPSGKESISWSGLTIGATQSFYLSDSMISLSPVAGIGVGIQERYTSATWRSSETVKKEIKFRFTAGGILGVNRFGILASANYFQTNNPGTSNILSDGRFSYEFGGCWFFNP